MDLLFPLFSGLTLGVIHAFDIDHIVAVSNFSSRTLNRWTSARIGAAWGLGHSVVLLVAGGLVVAFRLTIPVIIQEGAEVLVGILLIIIGVWSLRDYLRRRSIHLHQHTHDGVEHVHFHSHREVPGHTHSHDHS